MIWTILAAKGNPGAILGFLPVIFLDNDPRPAASQANDRYAHGGGWRPQEGFKMQVRDHSIKYPGDPVMQPIARTQIRDEKIYVYPYSYVAIVQLNGTFQVSRMD